MSNGKISFELGNQQHSLHFGMSAVRIFATKCEAEATRLGKEEIIDQIKAFAYLVYAGLCNHADAKDESRPSFDFAYELTEEILSQPEELQISIWNCYNESRAGKELNEKLEPFQKKNAEEKDLQPTGTE